MGGRWTGYSDYAMRRALAAICLGALLAPVAVGQSQAEQDRIEKRKAEHGHFQLFNDCEPMMLGVEVDSSDIGLTEERVVTVAAKRLRIARIRLLASDEVSWDIWDRGDPALLYIGISVSGSVYYISVQYKRSVTTVAGYTNLATTWQRSSFGEYGSNGSVYIMSELSGYLDEFLAAYLRINESACSDPAKR